MYILYVCVISESKTLANNFYNFYQTSLRSLSRANIKLLVFVNFEQRNRAIARSMLMKFRDVFDMTRLISSRLCQNQKYRVYFRFVVHGLCSCPQLRRCKETSVVTRFSRAFMRNLKTQRRVEFVRYYTKIQKISKVYYATSCNF